MNILLDLIVALIVAFALEAWQARKNAKFSWAKRQRQYFPSEVRQSRPPVPVKPGFVSFCARTFISVVAGFICAGFTAGIIESETESAIALNSPLAIILIILWTASIWYGLSKYGRYKLFTAKTNEAEGL